MSVISSLPEIYQKLLPQEILSLNCDESSVTCHSCLQVPRYKNELKCCTFHPILPNYLVGQILSEESPRFVRETLKHKIFEGHGILPLGVGAPYAYLKSYKGPQDPSFGQNEALLCPYFDRQNLNCGIWRNRGSVCASFYCRSSKGRAGLHFWEHFGNYLHYVEMSLAQWVLIQTGYSHRDIDDQLQIIEKGQRFDYSKSDLFREPMQFYVKSLELVKTLDRSLFVDWMGDTGIKLEEDLRRLGEIWK